MINENAAVDSLVAEGRYKEAAEAATEAAEHLRAAELYERIWDFELAAQSAESAGDLPRALANSLEAKNKTHTDRLADELADRGEQGQRSAMEVYVKHRHFAEGARLAEVLGDFENAAQWYQKGQLDLEAARMLVQLGRDRDAGRILERTLRDLEVGPERSLANLELGLIFARLLQHEAAVRCLQDSASQSETQQAAQRALVTELAALGLRDAARDMLIQVRVHEPELPQELDRFLRSTKKPTTPRSVLREARLIGGRYRLDRLLGSGASGRVYRATDEVTSQVVALKLLANTHSRNSEGYLRFAREAKVTKNLRHGNLIEVYDFSADLGFLVMEYMRGGSLETKLEGKLPATSIRRLCLDVLGGLELAHQRGIIHRDLKPANIFFDARGTAKIGDFGIAHLQDLGQTQTGGLIGTLAYMSPEQITGAPLTIAADLYGVGITLFEALCGRLPFLGPDFIAQHLGEQAPVPSQVSECSSDWDPILLRLLAKNPGDRYDSIGSLRRDLLSLELGDASRPLMMPPGTSRPHATSQAMPTVTVEDEPKEHKARYTFETPLGTTSQSTLARAIDTVLNRSVIIERFNEKLGEDRERRLYALARGGGPFLQRALSYERGSNTAIFEAPTGAPIGEIIAPLSTRLATRLLKRLARAIAPLHACDRAHGDLTGSTILLDERGHPTVLVCGLETLNQEPSPANDVEQIIKLVACTIGHAEDEQEPPLTGLVDCILEHLAPDRRAALLDMPTTDGEQLHTLAEAIEFELLQHKQGA